LFSALIIVLFSLLLFRLAGIFFNPISAVLSLVSAFVIREIIAQTASDREKEFIRKAFTTYVSDDVVEEIIANPEKLQLGGAKRHMSAIFTDIEGFSSIAEKLEPEDLVHILNHYLTSMSDLILKEKGTIDKYEGDAIIAFFGAPLELQDHAKRACLSAIALKRKEPEINRLILEEKLPTGRQLSMGKQFSSAPLLTRIGINTGSMVAGNMGTKNKMNYTIMGNTVNLTSRLERVNKLYGTWILTTKATLDEAGDQFLARRLDKVRVMGINEPVQLYELLETMGNAGELQKEMTALFENALVLYEKRNWKAAAKAFANVLSCSPEDKPSKIFIDRCKAYQKNPPPENWGGVFNLDVK
jgi:adenylate cyclase